MSELATLTSPDAGRLLRSARLALLPVGSCEQHGPHLTLDTDVALAEALARRLEADLGAAAILCPALPYGLSEHHLGFPGTLTLRPETLAHTILDVVESLAHWGLRRVLVLNGHGGNIDVLRLVSRQARRDLGALVASVMWARLAADEISARASGEQYGHACEIETSVAMVLAPDRVLRDRVSRPHGRRSNDPLTDPPAPLVDQAVWFGEWTADGALGDPSQANESLGTDIVEIVHARTLAYARRFMNQPLPT